MHIISLLTNQQQISSDLLPIWLLYYAFQMTLVLSIACVWLV